MDYEGFETRFGRRPVAHRLSRRVATHRSIEHLAQRDAIHDAAVHAKAHDAPRTLVHHHEHPVNDFLARSLGDRLRRAALG